MKFPSLFVSRRDGILNRHGQWYNRLERGHLVPLVTRDPETGRRIERPIWHRCGECRRKMTEPVPV